MPPAFANHDTLPPALSNYEISPLRWHFDGTIAEFNVLRAEMLMKKEQVDRTYAYIVTLLAAIIASQILSDGGIAAELDKHQTLYLLGAILSLWFPANVICLVTDQTTIGTYMREVLGPKMVYLADSAVAGAASRGMVGNLIGFGEEVGGKLPLERRQALEGAVLGWEEFWPLHRLGPRQLLPVYLLRGAFLFAPAALFLWLFFRHPAFGTWECALLAVTGVFVAANFSGGSYLMFGPLGQPQGRFRNWIKTVRRPKVKHVRQR